MARLTIGLLVGLLLGGVGTFYLMSGVPGRHAPPGVLMRQPDPSGMPPETAQIVLKDVFFNQVLDTIFKEMHQPTFELGPKGGEVCSGTLTLLSEGSGVKTGARFEKNRLEAPIAFIGSYNSLFGCYQFTGWANSVFELRFDQGTQSVFGQLNVENVSLDGVNPVVNALITPLVQSTLNTRVNPIRIIDGRQLAANIPISSAEGNLKAAVKDVRAEVRDNAVNLFIEYDLTAGPFVPLSEKTQ